MSWQLHNLSLTGIDYISINECMMTAGLGEHSELQLTLLVENEQQLVYEHVEMKEISLYLEQGEDQQTLFQGIITQVQVTCYADISYAHVIAKSRSYLLDITRKSRSFQDHSMKYSELLQEVFNDYEVVRCQMAFEDQEIGGLIVQYEETDWVFLKRILSQLEHTLTGTAQNQGICLYAGIPDQDKYSIKYKQLQMQKDLRPYYYLKANHQQPMDVYYTSYTIESYDYCKLFDQIKIDSHYFSIFQARYYVLREEWKAVYQLRHPLGLKQKIQYPYHLIGTALKGKITNRDKDMVQVHLEIDGEKTDRDCYWFPYSTISAAPNGSGWYCMPEIGDAVRIYFPTKLPDQAIALNAIGMYGMPEAGQDRMADTRRIYFSTKQNKELILDDNQIRIAINGGATSLTMETGGTIRMQAEHNIGLIGNDSLQLTAGGGICVSAKTQVSAASLKMPENEGETPIVYSQLSITEKNEVIVQGKNIELD